MPVKHIVMFGVQDTATTEQVEALKQGLLDLPKQIDLIQSHELGIDLKLAGGQNHPSGKNRTVAWSATFATAEDYQVYDTHAAHVAVITDHIKPIIIPGSRAAIQYEY